MVKKIITMMIMMIMIINNDNTSNDIKDDKDQIFRSRRRLFVSIQVLIFRPLHKVNMFAY